MRAVLEQVFTGHACSVETGVHWSCVQCWSMRSLVMCAVLEVFTVHVCSVGGVHWSCVQCWGCSLVMCAVLEVFIGHVCSVGGVHWSCVQCWRCSLVMCAVLEQVFTGHVCNVGGGFKDSVPNALGTFACCSNFHLAEEAGGLSRPVHSLNRITSAQL